MTTRRSVRRQRGAALLMALVIVTLIATMSTSMIWQQWRAAQVEIAERARVQAGYILSGALDWAGLLLQEDAKDDQRRAKGDHLGEPWSVPLAEARLSTFLAAEHGVATDGASGPDAFLSGAILDAQSRYNLRNLVDPAGKGVPAELEGLKRLLQAIDLSPALADTLALALQQALAPPGSPEAGIAPPLMPQDVTQLRWLGIDAATVRRLAPYVTLLPDRTPVNLNTAPKEVLVAAIDGLDLGSAQRLVQARQPNGFGTLDAAKKVLPPTLNLSATRVATATRYFEVHGRLRLEDRIVEEVSLVHRNGPEITPVWRQRHFSRESGD